MRRILGALPVLLTVALSAVEAKPVRTGSLGGPTVKPDTVTDTTFYITNRARRGGALQRARSDSLEFGLVVVRFTHVPSTALADQLLRPLSSKLVDSVRLSREEFVRAGESELLVEFAPDLVLSAVAAGEGEVRRLDVRAAREPGDRVGVFVVRVRPHMQQRRHAGHIPVHHGPRRAPGDRIGDEVMLQCGTADCAPGPFRAGSGGGGQAARPGWSRVRRR